MGLHGTEPKPVGNYMGTAKGGQSEMSTFEKTPCPKNMQAEYRKPFGLDSGEKFRYRKKLK